MFDGISTLYRVPDETGNLSALPCWEVLVNEQTGERVDECKTASLRGLHLAYKPSINGGYNFIIKGSLHKWHNAGTNNAGRFTIADVQTAVYGLCNVFEVEADRVELHGLEIGVNIHLPFPALRVLKNAVCYKGKAFTPINKRNVHKGLICTLNDYEVKMYDKAAQSGLDCGSVLRLETKVNKMRFLKDYNLSTLAALTVPNKAYQAKQILVNVLEGIIWTDTSASLYTMTDREQKQWLYLSNPKSWQNIAKEKAYRQRQKHTLLFRQYAKFDTGQHLKQLFSTTWESLFPDYLEAENCTPFHPLDQESEAVRKVTISPLECTVKRLPVIHDTKGNTDTTFCITPNTNTNSANTAQSKVLPVRCCSTCGKDISQQRKGSRFCSASYVGVKAARVCRNKDSNRRRHLKTIIKKAMQQNNFIKVTYNDTLGINGTPAFEPPELPAFDSLELPAFDPSLLPVFDPSEIETLSRQWLDKVKTIQTICRDELPLKLKGEKAKDNLQSFNNIQNSLVNIL